MGWVERRKEAAGYHQERGRWKRQGCSQGRLFRKEMPTDWEEGRTLGVPTLQRDGVEGGQIQRCFYWLLMSSLWDPRPYRGHYNMQM